MPPTPTKPALRAALKGTLATISPADRTASGQQLADLLLSTSLYQSADTIFAYASLPTEISLDPFIIAALADGKRICIPAINWNTQTMQPAQIQNLDTDLQVGRYGVRAPVPSCPLVEPNDIDLILIPGLAFDRDLNRLGRGAGFYDRMIESMSATGTRPPLVGVCFSSQIVDAVPTEAHDHPMDWVFTPLGLFETSFRTQEERQEPDKNQRNHG